MRRLLLAAVAALSLAGIGASETHAEQPRSNNAASVARSESKPADAKAKPPLKRKKRASTSVKAAKASGARRRAPGSAPRGTLVGAASSDLSPVVDAGPPSDLHGVRAVVSPELRHVRPIPPRKRGEGPDDHPEPIRPSPPGESSPDLSVQQTAPGATVSAPTSAGIGWDGVGVGLGTYQPSNNPPDVNGRVGATQYVQWNNTSFAIFDKTTGALQYGPAAGNTLFQSLGGACATHNDGDPVVSYDVMAGRWVLSQFVVEATPNASHQCFAVSVTGDATGAYYLYDFVTDAVNFVDYPHIGVWPDGYYMSAHVYNTSGSLAFGRMYVFERQKMLLGQTARMQSVDLAKDGSAAQYGFVPADVDSLTPPPAGAQQYVFGPNRQFTNRTNLWRLAVAWGTTPSITATKTTNSTVGIGTAPCVSNTAAQDNRDCVPQIGPGGGANVPADNLDNISSHYMFRAAYMNRGGVESLIVTGTTVGATTTPAHGAIKWMEWRGATGSTAPTLFQSGTYDPTSATSEYRWLPSGAMDKDGNIAIGYSKSSPTMKPGIWMTGRLSTDTINTMGAETQVQAGGGVQRSSNGFNAGNRWGDYSALTLDPVDQCTFYYTNEYLKTDGEFNWSTRIAAFKFPSCTAASAWGTLSGTIKSASTDAPISGVTVNLSNGFAGTSNASGAYSILVPAGTYTATVSGSDRSCDTASPATTSVTISSGSTTTQSFLMTGTPNPQGNGTTIDDTPSGNGNGIVNLNECVSLNVALKNNGCATASGVSATLTTSTPGVTVTQANSTYADMLIDGAATNGTPFKFQTSNSFVCGTTISFSLNLTYAGGSKSVGVSVPTCGSDGPVQNIPLSQLTTSDLTQSDRLGRDGVPSTCANKAGSGGFAGTKYYKTFTFTNTSGSDACYTVNINAALGGAGDIESAAYSPSYNPASLSTNLLGDSGISGLGTTVGNATYSFTVPALSTFVIVVNTTGTTTSSQFSGTVSGFPNTTAGPGACPACTPPATPTASNGGPYCAGSTIALSTPTVAGATYAWTGPNGFTSSLQNPTRANATVADAGTYSVTVTTAGCTSAAGTTNVVVNATPATPTASNTGAYCVGGTISLSTPAVAGATYAWTGPNGFTSALQSPTRANATAADAGTYSVTVTTNGCTSAAGTTNVVVNPIPATPTASNTGAYCAGSTISLSTPTVAGATYSWTGPNGFTSALQNPTRANATTADAGTYSVTVTTNGCTSAAGTTNVVVNPTPATPTASNTGAYCAGSTISLSTPTVAGATYSWTGPNGFTSALQNPTRANATVADAGTYSVTVTTNGCTSAAGTTSVVVNPIPATPTASNGGPYCTGSTISLSTPAVAGATYSWTGPNGFTSSLQNPTRPNATTADAGTYSVTVTTNGCTSAAGTTTVVVNPTPATPTASNTGAYCESSTISLSTPFVVGATYAWTGPNGFTSALQNPTRANATVADAGTYSVTVTTNGCTSAAGTTNVVVNATPATPTASNGGPYCAGSTISLSTPTVAGATYSWTGPAGFTSSLQNPTRANATTAHAGTYSVTVTVNGCTSAAGTTNVVVNTMPATPTASDGGPYCEGGTISLATPTVAGATYSWTGPNGFTSALQNPTRANATVADAGTYSVTVTTNGCTSAAGTTNVVVNPAPATPTASNGGPYCAGSTISLSTPTVAGATYSWTGPAGFTSALQNPTRANATTAHAGTYSVTVTVNGCTSAAGTTNVVVNTMPATPTASNGGPYCEAGTISLSTPTVAGATYSWTGPNGFSSSLQNPTRANATTADAGTYSVTVTTNGCTSAAGTTNVVVNTMPATPTASNGGPYCEGSTISLSTPTVAGATYSWTGPNGFTSSLQNPTRANATTADAGTYSVTVTTNGCTSAAGTTNVVVNATPATPTASNGGPYCEGSTISLSTPTVSGATYSWTGPNGFTSALQNPTRANATTADAGTYSVTVTVNGCTSVAGTTNVVVNAIPSTPTASNGGPYCEGSTISLSTPTVSGATYSWTGPNGFTSALQNPTRANATTADAGTYSVTITVNGCTSAAGTTNVVINAAPATPTASNGGPYCEGSTISLSTPFVSGATYAWTGPNGFTSTQQNPTRSSATVADAGTYAVTITVNGCTSAAGTTNVVINAAPATPTASNGGPYCEGGTIALSTPFVSGATYAWTGPNGFTSTQQNPTRSNATTADSGTYSVTVTTNGCTSAAGSTNVVVNATPSTPTASNGGPYCAGSTISLSTPFVAGATYSWTGPNGFTSSLQNPTRASSTVADAGTYAVTITVNGCTSAAGTTNVVVSAAPATPTITPGGPTTFCAGGSVTLTSSSASGNQWYLDGNPIGGATSNTFNATASGNYTVVVTSAGCSSAPSAATAVTVNPIPATPTITPGGPTTFCAGGSVTLTSSSASGNQWYLNGNPIGGATSNTFNATASGNYTVVVTTSGCASAASAATTVTVTPAPATPTITPDGPTTFCGGSSVTLTSSSATGNQWYLNGNPIAGETNQSLVVTSSMIFATGNFFAHVSVTVTSSGCSASSSQMLVEALQSQTPTISAGGPTTFCAGGSVSLSANPEVTGQWYRDGNLIAGATDFIYSATTSGSYTFVNTFYSNCPSSPSNAIAVTVNPVPATPTVSVGGPTTFCAGGSVTLTSSSASGNQWYLNGNPIGGATNNTFNATASGNYTVVVTSGGCASAPSASMSVTVNPTPSTPTITPGGPTTFCAGGSVTLTSSSASGNQWYLNGNPIGGATSNMFNATASGNYTVVVTSSGCSSAPSAATSVSANPIPATPTITPSGPTTFCAGGSVTLTSSSASGNQWYLNGNPIGGATSQQYVATASGNYTVTASNGGCSSSASAATSVTVNPTPATPTVTPGGPTTFCAGGSVTLTSSSASGNQWYLNGNPIGGATSQQYVATASGNYTVTASNGGCTSSASAVTAVTVNPVPATPTINASGPTTFCAGSSVTLTSSSASGNQWYLNGNPIGGATSQTFVATGSGDLTVVVGNGSCVSSSSATVSVVVNPIPSAAITVASSMTAGTSGNASVADAGAGATYAWSISNGTITSATNSRTVTFTAGASGSVTLTATVGSNGCSDTKSASVTITAVAPTVTLTSVTPPAGTWRGGTSVTLTGSGFASGATVTFGGAAATSVVVVNATTITCTTPAHAGGLVDVVVTNTDASTATLSNGYRFVPQQFDPNGDTVVDPADIFYLVNYLFVSGPAPQGAAGMLSGDANGDGAVDPADIFYAVNYLFTGGPEPMSTRGRVAASSDARRISGSLSLGAPVERDGRYLVPIILSTADDSVAPQAIAMHVRATGASVVVRRAGAARSLPVTFEVTRPTASGAAWLVSFGSGVRIMGGESKAIVAELEVTPRRAGSVTLSFDPALTMLSDGSGTAKASAARGDLTLFGTTIDAARPQVGPAKHD